MKGQQIRQLVQRDFEKYVRDLEFITNIDSGSGNKQGCQAIAAFLEKGLTDLGGQVEFRENENAVYTIARFQGKGFLKILLIGHIDTVFPAGEASRRPFRLDQNLQAYGPGVGDDKASVIQMVYAMQYIRELGFENYGEIILFFSGEEETGSPFGEKILTELAQSVQVALILDTAPVGFGLTTRRKGRSVYEIKVSGKSGHAGNSPFTSASATMELAYQLTKLYNWASPISEELPPITINVAIIQTKNNKLNVIPNEASAQLEVRAFTLDELQKIDEAIKNQALQVTIPGTSVEVLGGIEQSPLEKNNANNLLIQLYKEVVLQEYAQEIKEESAGGVTDGNLTASYVPTLDGLGIENYEEHTVNESVDLRTVEPRIVALLLFIEALCQKGIE